MLKRYAHLTFPMFDVGVQSFAAVHEHTTKPGAFNSKKDQCHFDLFFEQYQHKELHYEGCVKG
jgi:hypothetical protein